MATTLDWLVGVLAEKTHILSTEIINDNFLIINRKEGESISVAISKLDNYDSGNIERILASNDADFILHVPREPFINGDAFALLEKQTKILGGFGDLFKVLDQPMNWPYYPKDVGFILRGLRQHSRVNAVSRLDNKRYEIDRPGLDSVTVIALDDYDLSVESVRCAIDEFDSFDAILKSNPNGRISGDAAAFASSVQIMIFRWGELMGMLNKKWSWKK